MLDIFITLVMAIICKIPTLVSADHCRATLTTLVLTDLSMFLKSRKSIEGLLISTAKRSELTGGTN
jgi:hypothetical protein